MYTSTLFLLIFHSPKYCISIIFAYSLSECWTPSCFYILCPPPVLLSYITTNNFPVCHLMLISLWTHGSFSLTYMYNLKKKKWPSQVVLVVKNLPVNAEDTKDSFDPRVGKIPWSRRWQPTPVFLPGKSLGQRSLVVYGSRSCRELDMSERLHTQEKNY